MCRSRKEKFVRLTVALLADKRMYLIKGNVAAGYDSLVYTLGEVLCIRVSNLEREIIWHQELYNKRGVKWQWFMFFPFYVKGQLGHFGSGIRLWCLQFRQGAEEFIMRPVKIKSQVYFIKLAPSNPIPAFCFLFLLIQFPTFNIYTLMYIYIIYICVYKYTNVKYIFNTLKISTLLSTSLIDISFASM